MHGIPLIVALLFLLTLILTRHAWVLNALDVRLRRLERGASSMKQLQHILTTYELQHGRNEHCEQVLPPPHAFSLSDAIAFFEDFTWYKKKVVELHNIITTVFPGHDLVLEYPPEQARS